MRRFEMLTDEEKVVHYERLARKALSPYGMSDGRLRFIAHGHHLLFEVHLAKGEGHYVLRIAPPDSKRADLLRELLWLASLGRDVDLAVPEPILTRSGEILRSVSIEGVPGTHPCMLLRWVEGTRIGKKSAPEDLERVGATIGRVHDHAEGFPWPREVAPARPRPDRLTVLLERLSSRRFDEGAAQSFERVLPRIAMLLGRLDAQPRNLGVIHGDLRRDKILVDHGKIGIVGFDRSRMDYFLFDLLSAVEGFEETDEGHALSCRVVDGYRSTHPLPEDWEEIFPPLKALRAAEGAATQVEEAKTRGFPGPRLGAALERLKGLCEEL
jgi:Ser/Thr protein kinase RdoA (MazF antagonist)